MNMESNMNGHCVVRARRPRAIIGAVVLLILFCVSLPLGVFGCLGGPKPDISGTWEGPYRAGTVTYNFKSDHTYSGTISGIVGLKEKTVTGTWSDDNGLIVVKPFLYVDYTHPEDGTPSTYAYWVSPDLSLEMVAPPFGLGNWRLQDPPDGEVLRLHKVK